MQRKESDHLVPPGYNRLSTNVIAVRQGLKNQPTSALFGSKSGIENLIAFLHKSGATRPQTTFMYSKFLQRSKRFLVRCLLHQPLSLSFQLPHQPPVYSDHLPTLAERARWA